MKILPYNELQLKILNQRGQLQHLFRQPLRSFVRQYADLIQCGFQNAGSSVKDTGGTNRSPVPPLYMAANAPSTNTNYGILVGTGATALSISDYNLHTKISHGSGAGQLAYGATTVNSVVISAPTAYFTVTRNFVNNSGADITVEEAGLATIWGSWYFLLIRDLTGSIVVQATKTLAAQYTLTIAV